MSETRIPSLWVVIPAYNEETMIANVIADLKHHGYHHILVVDDGSGDRTAEKAREAGAEVLRHLVNRGQGGALRTGIRYVASEYRPAMIVTFDSDGQHQAKNIESLLRPLREKRADIVLGSRFLTKRCSIPHFRYFILKLAVLFTNVISRVHLTDTHNGLRAFNERAYTAIRITHRGMEHASDIIDEISRHRLRYVEAPVDIVYTDYSREKGQQSLGFIKMGVKIILHKLM